MIDIFRTQFSHVAQNLGSTIIAGDLNIDLLKNDLKKLNLENTIAVNGFQILNKINSEMATRVTKRSLTLLDLFLTNNSNKFKTADIFMGDYANSDHRFLILSLKFTENISQENPDTVLDSYIKWDEAPKKLVPLASLNKSFIDFHRNLSSVIDKNTYFKPKRVEPAIKKFFLNKSLKTIQNNRDRYYKLKIKFPDNTFFLEKFKFYKLSFKKSLIEAKRCYYTEKVKLARDNPKKIWKITKELLTNKRSIREDESIELLVNSIQIKEPKNIVSHLNNFFASVGKNIIDHNITHSPRPILLKSNPMANNSIHLNNYEHTTPNEVASIISNLKRDTSSGYDDVSVDFLKKNINFFSLYLSSSINDSLDANIFPNSLKIARIKPIYKSGSKYDPSNYRPISILPIFSKVFEIVIRDRLESFITENNIINKNQFGFIKASSTTSACAALLHEIVTNINLSKKTACTFIDLKKAFDSLNFEKLLSILYDYGIRKCIIAYKKLSI